MFKIKHTPSFQAILDWNNHVLEKTGATYDVHQLDIMALRALQRGDMVEYEKLSSLVTSYPR